MESYHLVRFEDGLDVSRYPEFRSAFKAIPRDVPVLIDLTLAAHVDSTFLSELLLLRRRHEAALAVVVAPEGNVARMIEIANFATKMNVFTDVTPAIASLGVTTASAGDQEGVAAPE